MYSKVSSKQYHKMLKQIGATFNELGMKHNGPQEIDSNFHFLAMDNTGEVPIPVMASLSPHADYIDLMIPGLTEGPTTSAGPLFEMLNLINQNLGISHFVAERIPESTSVIVVSVRAGLIVKGGTIDKDQFKTLVQDTIQAARNYKSLIERQLQTGDSPQTLMDEFVMSNTELFAN